ncbi:hypothetical protein BV22DRAFT_1049583 [Leucogyrophana mollusca]|uniref:Uncharacterized protein n=1 Tax=Leucogyrophana mollusca TaxID=85980 RepID=A0ACB8B6Z0_9AGAM|nr:hypothetical protein BV22DRAFT_1049583 [Leucogyrophana mollusca]
MLAYPRSAWVNAFYAGTGVDVPNGITRTRVLYDTPDDFPLIEAISQFIPAVEHIGQYCVDVAYRSDTFTHRFMIFYDIFLHNQPGPVEWSGIQALISKGLGAYFDGTLSTLSQGSQLEQQHLKTSWWQGRTALLYRISMSQPMSTMNVPSETELVMAIQYELCENPEVGMARLINGIKAHHPHWSVGKKRIRRLKSLAVADVPQLPVVGVVVCPGPIQDMQEPGHITDTFLPICSIRPRNENEPMWGVPARLKELGGWGPYIGTFPRHRVHSAYYAGSLHSTGRVTLHSMVPSSGDDECPLYLSSFFPDTTLTCKHRFLFYDCGVVVKSHLAYYDVHLHRENARRAPYLIVGFDCDTHTFTNLCGEDIVYVAYAVNELVSTLEITTDITEYDSCGEGGWKWSIILGLLVQEDSAIE